MIKDIKDISWIKLTESLSKKFAEKAKEHDKEGRFVYDNYRLLKKHKYFSAIIPKELGGSGVSYSEMCECIKLIGKSCGSTALAFSMHQHLIAASIWKYYKDGSNEVLLRNISKHELILISTGARDWLSSNGSLKKTHGGYLFSAKKHFASQSSIGDLAITSGIYEDPSKGKLVLHFGVPMNSVGVSLLDDWNVMGMRSTGSQTIIFDNVFIPDSAISLERTQGEFHGVWNVVIPVAMPLIMSAYVGISEGAFNEALRIGKTYQRNQDHLKYILGKAYNAYLMGLVQWQSMIKRVNDLNFNPGNQKTVDILSLKTNVTHACKETVNQSMDAIGGQSFYKTYSLERMFRDIQAGNFHPLPKWEQYAFTGDIILNKINN
ncbi:acyl-CoA dehydrogenase family protein [Yeosuana sp. MJ-SS3]|uniref:Acyl-CoA dehydrogenase family protein n=1 Tax=Gilvirhabdus luticola TaxID=3079858 RepID=A0ABU3U3V0_9FLAO|nr:acyl-CoA dehydrogenase family protein [Yeosuana sp. MJ-SS3]MDU8885026.1 acyl-CoA dehydrogenase family protein [Yeosuana sp. MJ-SS3]